jgi:endonuclease/exonuclease/phosphatase family metal-dependent hydrolase
MLANIEKLVEAPYERVTTRSYDGLKLVGKLYEAERKDAPLILFFHGYRSTAERDASGGFQLCREKGWHILMVDQRALGESEGKEITFGIRERFDCQIWAEYAAKRFGEQTAIFYLRDSITVQESGTFWLTETPGQVSRLEGHYHFRTATWVKALHKSTNVVFYHINTHLDNCGNDFRSVELSYVLDFIKENCEDYPVVMTADWNEHDEHSLFNDLYKTVKNARFTASITDRGATFNNFGANTDYLRIDHVFYKGFASCSKFAVERRAWNGHAYISDHYPIYATLHF